MIQPVLAAALVLAQAAPAAAPAERPCITPAEAGDVAISLLPFLVDAAAQRCRPHLASGAFLLTGADDWSARLRRDAAPRRASALRGMTKFAGAMAPAGAGGDAAFDFFAQLVTAGLTGNLRTENCAEIDTIAQSLQPLPTDNIARLIGATLTLALTANENGTAPGEGDDRDNDPDDDDDNDVDADDEGGENGGDGPPICRS